MYDQDKLIEIIKKAKGTNSLNEFARISDIDSGYLSRIINKLKTTPPSPSILEKLAKASNGVVTHNELMQICGYINFVDSFFDDSVLQIGSKIPLIHNISFINNSFIVDNFGHYINSNFKLNKDKEYFAYEVKNNEMYPLLSTKDIAIVIKTSEYESGKTYLISLDNELILIRKIIKNTDITELQAMNPYFPVIKLTNEDIKERNFTVIGRVIRAENKSAFE